MNGWRGFNSYYKCMWRAAPGVEYEEMHIGQTDAHAREYEDHYWATF